MEENRIWTQAEYVIRESMERRISGKMVEEYRQKLMEDEKSRATIEKYVRDIRGFQSFMRGEPVTKAQVISYKEQLLSQYAVSSVNSVLAALNGFFKYMEWYSCVVKLLKIQRDSFRSSERELSREEYWRLLETARRRGNERLYLVMQTICATGIRVSELPFITVETVPRCLLVVSVMNCGKSVQ